MAPRVSSPSLVLRLLLTGRASQSPQLRGSGGSDPAVAHGGEDGATGEQPKPRPQTSADGAAQPPP